MSERYGCLQKEFSDGLIDSLTSLRLEICESWGWIDFKTIPLVVRCPAEVDAGHRKTHCLTQLQTSVHTV